MFGLCRTLQGGRYLSRCFSSWSVVTSCADVVVAGFCSDHVELSTDPESKRNQGASLSSLYIPPPSCIDPTTVICLAKGKVRRRIRSLLEAISLAMILKT